MQSRVPALHSHTDRRAGKEKHLHYAPDKNATSGKRSSRLFVVSSPLKANGILQESQICTRNATCLGTA